MSYEGSNVYFAYSDTELTSVQLEYPEWREHTFDDDEYVGFSCVEYPRFTINSDEVLVKTLRGRRISHRLSKFKAFKFVIAANELFDTALYFMEDWWTANYKYIAIYDNNEISEMFEVVTKGGEFPVEYIDNNINLPELKLELTKANEEV